MLDRDKEGWDGEGGWDYEPRDLGYIWGKDI